MAEDPIRTFYLDPNNVALYDNSVAPAILLDWDGFTRQTFTMFYERQYLENNGLNPISISLMATQPNPDTIFNDFVTAGFKIVSLISPVELESAAPIDHTSNLVALAVLWSKVTHVDPTGDANSGNACRASSVACSPEAAMEMISAPIAGIVMANTPVANIVQEDSPMAILVCRINT
jgi:hypothetical protein